METTIKYPGFRWVVLATMILVTVAQSVVMIAPSPLIGEISHSLGINVGTATAAFMALFNLALGIGSILGGFLLEKIGIGRSYLIGLIFIAVGSLLIPIAGHNLGALIVLRIIQGLGAGPITGSVARVAAEWFPVNERAMVAGVQGTSISLGVAIGFIFAPGIFASTHSWTAAMAWTSIFCVIGLIVTIIMLVGPKAPVLPENEAKVNLKPYMSVMMAWTCILSATLLCWVFSSFNDLTPGYIAIPAPVGLGHGPVAAGKIMMIYQLAFMIGSLLCGLIVQKVFRGKEKPVIMIGFILTAILTFFVGQEFVYTNNTILTGCLILAGFFMSLANPAIFSFISKKYPLEVAGKIGGIAMGVGIFGSSIGILVGSIALGKTGNYQMSIVIVSIVAILGFVNILFLNDSRPINSIEKKSIGA